MKTLFGKLCLIARFIFLENIAIQLLCRNRFFNTFYWFAYSNIVRRFLIPVLSLTTSYDYFKDSFCVHWVDPKEINNISCINEEEFVYNLRYGRYISGSWDDHEKKIENLELYKELKKYLENENWSETNLGEIFQYREKKWCQDVNQRKEELDKLIENLQKDGYKSQRDLFKENPQEVLKKCNDTLFPQLNEIQVSVGRNGELFWETNGQHRLIIAKLIGTKEVPVILRAVHFGLSEDIKEVMRNHSS